MYYAESKVQQVVCSVQCEVCSVQCEVCTVHCEVCSVQCAVFNVFIAYGALQCLMVRRQCEIFCAMSVVKIMACRIENIVYLGAQNFSKYVL